MSRLPCVKYFTFVTKFPCTRNLYCNSIRLIYFSAQYIIEHLVLLYFVEDYYPFCHKNKVVTCIIQVQTIALVSLYERHKMLHINFVPDIPNAVDRRLQIYNSGKDNILVNILLFHLHFNQFFLHCGWTSAEVYILKRDVVFIVIHWKKWDGIIKQDKKWAWKGKVESISSDDIQMVYQFGIWGTRDATHLTLMRI